MNQRALSAAVLAGGRSLRMGTDKALLPLVPGGTPMLGLVLEQLRTISDDLVIVAPPRPGYGEFGTRVVPDLYPGGSALVGIHAALAHAAHQHCLVVACDMPFLNPALLQHMAMHPRDYDVFVPLLPGKSRQRPDGF